MGGVETHLVDFAAALVAAGALVTMMTGTDEPDHSLLPPAVDHVYVPILDMRNRLGVEYYDSSELSALKRAILDVAPDVVHVHNMFPLASRDLARTLEEIRETTGAPLFHTFHSEWPPRPAVFDRTRWSGFLTVSSFLQQRYRAHGLDSLVVRLPVDSDRFAPREVRAPGPVRLLHPARLTHEKGQLQAVRAVAALRRRGVDVSLTMTEPLQIFGSCTRQQRYKRRLDQVLVGLGLEGVATFAAPTLREMPGLYAVSDIVLYPSVFPEPSGLVPLEAMSGERPVIVTAVGGMPELVEHGVNGLIVRDPLDLADAVASLIADPARARSLGQAGLDYVRDAHSVLAFSHRLLSLYERALHSGRPATTVHE